MTELKVSFSSDMEYNDVKLPKSMTGDLPFEIVKGIISNRPIKRRAVDLGRPFTEEESRNLSKWAKQNPPPQSWFDEDFSDL